MTTKAERCERDGHPLTVWTTGEGEERRPYLVLCFCGLSKWVVPAPAELERLRGLAKVLTDLDRCQHGRHRIDNCFSCPGGQSTGNTCLPLPGMPVGHDLAGVPYFVPSGERPDPLCTTDDPAAWRRDPRAAPVVV